MVSIALRYDLRAPEWAATPHDEGYRICLEQSAWADTHGIDTVVLSEHHGMDDGFLPAPLVLAGAVAGVTSRMPIVIAALLVPLHDPVRLAEQLTVLDLASGGRVISVVGIGYAEREFEMAGIDRSKRGKLVEEFLEVMQQAWSGEPFEWQGREVQVTPKPRSQPHPPLLYGGSTEVAARRAAKFRLGFFPAIGDPALRDIYLAAAEETGFEFPFCMLPGGPGFVHVTEDPERDWAVLERYAWHDASTYAAMQTAGQRSEVTSKAADIEQLKQEGIYRVVTPDECVALAQELEPEGTVTLHPLMCGMPADMGWSSLELFADKVLPRIRPTLTIT